MFFGSIRMSRTDSQCDAPVAHRAAFLQSGHRAGEIDVVAGRIGFVEAGLRQPDDEGEQAGHHHQREAADQKIAGTGLHRFKLPPAAEGGAAARSVEIFPNPGMVQQTQGLHRVHQDAFVDQHRDTVADRAQAVEIVGHHEDGQAQAALKALDQLVESRRADRVEPRRRLVQEQDFRIERQRAGQPRPLPHAAGQLRRKLQRRLPAAGRSWRSCMRATSAMVAAVQRRMLLQRHLDVFRHRHAS